MCFFYSLVSQAQDIEKHFSANFNNKMDFKPKKKTNAFAHEALPVITNEDPDQIKFYNWGLIPFWVKDKQSAIEIRKNTPNARSESIFEKPSFRDSIVHKRCLIPSNGFYEWKHEGKSKIPYFIFLNNQDLFAYGGIWSSWKDKQTNEVLNTFSIITTEANPLMAEIHNTKKRMPLIISTENYTHWLDNKIDKNGIIDLMTQFDEKFMKAEMIKELDSDNHF